ncbi:ABC transporter substrate-binding protein [Variovorax sp. PBL-E5]|uniref:ABC transporter substrate-binding protein n=1 Tax=Variovorax sp. PBL-E5 TaxID=434014 RepID=UPI001318D5CF|nr:ABC transporter substrate-binding protein [Variovorax sp. PBL-E5]VTU20384.1 Receptor family ligand binding region [Variovorax sp. PBL-E5]
MKRLRLPLPFTCSAACALLLLAPWAHAEITVGVVLSMTGAASSQGIPEKNMIALLPDKLGGEPVKYIVLDDATDPTLALKDARKLVSSDQVDVLIGSSNTPNALALASVALESRTPQVSPAPMDVPANQHPWVFVVPQSADLMIDAVLENMKKKGIKTVGYIGYSQPWGDQVQHSLATLSGKYGIQPLNDERFERTDSSVVAQVVKTMALKPDAILIGATGTPAALPHLTLVERGYKGPIYHTHGVVNDDFLRVGGARVEGALAPIGPVVVFKDLPDSDPVKKVSKDFSALYTKAYGAGPVNAFATWAYDSYLLLDKASAVALKKARPGTAEFRAALRDALENNTAGLVGTNGIYHITPTDHNGLDKRARVMVRVSHADWRLAE